MIDLGLGLRQDTIDLGLGLRKDRNMDLRKKNILFTKKRKF